MNNIKKIGLSALAGSLAITSAHAVEYSMSGDAIIKFASADAPTGTEAQSGKGIGVDTDLALTASGELDNGFTVSFFQAADTHGAWSNSSSQVTIGMGSMGTLQFNNISGAKANGIDDVMPAAYNETWDGLALAADNPTFFGSSTASGSVDYRIPAMEMAGATINASVTYDPSADVGAPTAGGVSATSVGGMAYTLEIAHESGLSVGAGQETIDNGSLLGGDEENVTAYAKFAMGPLTVGYQEAYQNSANGGQDNEAEFMGIAYTSGDVSVSYGESSIQGKPTAATANPVEREMDSIQISYTMGAMTIAGAMGETSNQGGIAGQTYEESEISVSFAF